MATKVLVEMMANKLVTAPYGVTIGLWTVRYMLYLLLKVWKNTDYMLCISAVCGLPCPSSARSLSLIVRSLFSYDKH